MKQRKADISIKHASWLCDFRKSSFGLIFLFLGSRPLGLALEPSPSTQPQFVFGGPGHHLYLAALASSCIYWPLLIRIGNNNVSILCYYLYFNGSCIEMKQKVIQAKKQSNK